MGTIDLNHLVTFMTVAETAGFSAAAQRLGVPKSSVSRSIASLEAAMGVQLVHRTTRRVALSTSGAALYERVAPLLRSLDEAVAGLPELGEEPSGELRVTSSVDFGATVLSEIVARFAARYPAVRLNLHLTNQMVDLVAEGIDVAVRLTSSRLKDSSLTAKRAGPLTIELYASPSYLASHGTPRTPRDLAGHEWIVFRSGEPLRLEGPGGAVEVSPRGRIVCDDMSFVRGAVRAGGGLGALPHFLAGADVASGHLVRVLPKWDLRSGEVWVVWPGGRNVPRKVAAFRDFVIQAITSGQ